MIKRCRVQNFKSIVDVEVRLSPVTVLAGLSGSGKSSFLESFDLLRYLITGEPAPWFNGVTPNATLLRPGGGTANEAFRSRFDLSFDAPGANRQLTYNLEVGFHHNAVEAVAELLKLSGDAKPIFAWRDGKWSHQPKLDGVNPQNHPSKLRWLTTLEDANIAYLTLGRGVSFYEFPPAVLTQTRSQRGDNALMRDGSNAGEVLRGIMENLNTLPRWRCIEGAFTEWFPRIESIARDPHRNNELAVLVCFNESTAHLSLSQQSVGFRRILAHLLAIYQATTPPMVIFDEPDNGISADLLPMLAEHMLAAAKELGTQFLITTHNPELVRCFPAESIRRVQMTAKGTRILPITDGDMPDLMAELGGGSFEVSESDAHVQPSNGS